jgi:predicted amidohydrolase
MVSLNAALRFLRISNALALAVLVVTIFASQSVAEETIRVAAISYEPQKFNLTHNADRLEQLFRDAQQGGARIAVAPEGALDGYVVNEIIAGQEAADRMKEVAIEIDGPVINRFQKLAEELKMCLVFGFAEKVGDDVYNCAVFIDHAGQVCGKYHKMQLAEGYDESWWYNRLGDRCRAFDTPFGRCGILICNDRWNAQLAKITALDGAQFLVIPSFGSTGTKQDEAVLNRAVENSVPVIEANVGVTLIVSDNQIAAVDREKEGITWAEITIPDPRPVETALRDAEEQRFLLWRAEEMPKRLEKRMRQVKD